MGKPVDMAAIRSRNETVRAIGNMGVNARGDILDSNNNVVNQGTQRVNRVYSKTTVNPTAQTKGKEVQPTIVADEQVATPTATPTLPVTNQTAVEENGVLVIFDDSLDDEFSDDELEFEQELEQEVIPLKEEPKSKKKWFIQFTCHQLHIVL